jgi:hypothetical protein
MSVNKTKIPFAKGEGVYDLYLLDDLNLSRKHRDSVKNTFIKNLNKKMNTFKINRWVALLMPLGLIVLILGAIFLKNALMILVIFLGVFIICVFPFYLCTKWRNLRNQVEYTVKRIREKTNGAVIVRPKYKKKIHRNASGVSSFRVLSYFKVEVNDPHNKKVKPNPENKNHTSFNLELEPGANSKQNGHLSPKNHFETNEDEWLKGKNPRRKETDAYYKDNEEQDEFGKALEEHPGKNRNVNVDMVQLKGH